MAERTCPHCGDTKAAEFFYRNRSRASGLSTYCKACTQVVRSLRYRDKIREQKRRWNEANPDRVREHGKRWAQANRESIRLKKARQVASRPDQYRAYAATSDRNRRAREATAPGRATADQSRARWDYFGGRCWMCGGEATDLDHVKPLARGGSAWPSNLRPSCRTCNASKHARWPYPLEVFRERPPTVA